MSTTTSNYNLIKPDEEEFYNVDIPNGNMDIIDTQIKEMSDNLVSHKAETATETEAGHVELATAAETTTGTDNTRAVHPAGLKVELDKKIAKALLSAKGDIIYASAINTPAKLAIGSTGQYLKVKSDGTIEWGELDVIQPTKLKSVDLAVASSTVGTWYTVLNITAGKGILNRLSASSGNDNSQVTARITIDGVQHTFMSNSMNNILRGFYRASNLNSIDFLGPVFFTASLKIEVSSSIVAELLRASADYSLV